MTTISCFGGFERDNVIQMLRFNTANILLTDALLAGNAENAEKMLRDVMTFKKKMMERSEPIDFFFSQ